MPSAVIPEWTSRTSQQVIDAYWLVYARAHETGQWRSRGRGAALQWVLAGGTAPFDGMERPTTQDEAFGALRLVEAHRDGGPTDSAMFAAGAADVLLWLLDIAADPGFVVPLRGPDGQTPTARELLEEAERTARAEFRTWTPEVRRDAEREASTLAGRYRAAAEAADRAIAAYRPA